MPALAAVHAVLLNPDHLLRLEIRHAELYERGLLARRDGGAGGALIGRREHQKVTEDDAADRCRGAVVVCTSPADFPAGGHVDVIAGLERAGQELVLITFDLVGALRALDLRADALLPGRREAARADLLALEHILSGDVLRQLLRVRDRTRNDRLPRDRLLLEHLLIDDLRATRA